MNLKSFRWAIAILRVSLLFLTIRAIVRVPKEVVEKRLIHLLRELIVRKKFSSEVALAKFRREIGSDQHFPGFEIQRAGPKRFPKQKPSQP